MKYSRSNLLLYAVLGLITWPSICAPAFTNVTIISSPAGIPVSGFTNTFEYRISSSVNLTCHTEPAASPSATFEWDDGGCTTCFPSNQTIQTVTESSLTLHDAGTFTCTVTEGGNTSNSSDLFTLRVDYAPSNVRATVLTSQSIEVSWDAFSASSGITGYLISYTTNASYTTGGTVNITDVNTARYILTDLEEDTHYTINVRAVSSSGMSDNGTEVSLVTYTAAPSSPPQNIMAAYVDPASLMITWDPPPPEHQNGPIIGYIILYHRDGDIGNTESINTVGTSVTITGLIPFVSYSFQVAARNNNGTQVFSSSRNQVSGQAVPEAPISLTVDNATDTTVTLSWMEPNVTNGIIINYQIQYRVAFTDQQYNSSQNITSLNYTVTGLSSNTEYEFRVVAATRVGFGDPTSSIFKFTALPAPIVNISASDNQTVGQSLTLQCEVIAGSGVIRTVDIVWSSDGMELERMDGVSSTPMSNSEVYTHSYTISQLSTTDDGRVIECDVTITESLSMTLITRNITLDVTIPTPTVTISPSGPIQGAMVGSLQVINCTVSTVSGVESSVVIISWMGPSVTNDSRVAINSTTPSGNVYTSSLQFTYLMEGDEGTYTCNVMILDTSAAASVDLNSLSVATPTVTVTDPGTQTVGSSLTLQCNVTTVRGITSRVDIVWSSGGMELERMNNVSSTTMGNSLVYTHSYSISQLSTTDDDRVIQCEVVINASPSVMATDNVTLIVTLPDPNVTLIPPINPTVGQSLTLQCEMTTVRGITSRVDIVWSSSDMEVQTTNGTTATTMGNSSVYTDSYNISFLTTSYNERVIKCEVVINANPPITFSDSFTLNVDVPMPTVTIQLSGSVVGAMVGSPLSANCTVTTVDGVEYNAVVIDWSGPGVATERFTISNVTASANNVFYKTLNLAYLISTDDHSPYFCVTTILEAIGTGSFELESLTDPLSPVVTISPSGPIEDTTVGDPQTISCIANKTIMVNADLLMFAWSGPQGDITSNGRVTIQPTYEAINNVYISTLEFDYLIESDGGSYTCNVTFFTVYGISSVEIESPDYAPTDVSARVLSPQSVEVTWNPSHPSLTNVTSYIIFYTTTASYAVNGNLTVNGSNTTNATLTDLEENTPYTITIQAISARDVISGDSNEVSVTTYTDVPSSPPVNITVMSAHPGSLELSWQPPPEIYQNGPITGYEIQYTMVGSTVTMDEVISNGNMYTITELLPFVNYSVVMAAITVNGTGPFSDPVIELSGHEEPSEPVSVTLTSITYTTLTVSWEEPLMPNGIIERYDLEYRILGDTLFTRQFPSGNARNFTIIDLTPNTTYMIRLAAVTVVGRGPYSMDIINSTLTPVVTIVSSPAGTPVSGSTNTFDYPILSNVTLMCLLAPLPVINVTYSWNTTRCYTNPNYAGGNPRCFPNGQTTQNVTDSDVTAEDAGTITCTVTINNYVYTSEPFTLRVSGIAITRDNQLIANNILPDYSYINASVTSTNVIIASCVTGLGPSGSDDNNALGGLYFKESSIPNGVCNSTVIQPNGRPVNSFVGVINMFQCGTFTVAGEGVYTCTMMNSSVMYQSTRFGIYFIGRIAPYIDITSSSNITADIGATIMLSCTSRGSPPDTFTWKKDNDPTVLQSTSITAVDHTSTTAEFRADYSVIVVSNGTYTCTVANPIGSDNANITIIAIVPAPPNVTVSPSILNATVGEPQVIYCTAITPTLLDVVIDWVEPEGSSIMNDSRVTISSINVTNDIYSSSLQFDYMMEGDEGSYTCIVSLLNVSGSDSIEILALTVPTPIVSVTAPNTQTVGQSLTLQCEVTTVRGITSTVDIEWSSGGMELDRMDNVNATIMGNSLVYTHSYMISLLDTNEDGRVYECEAVINSSPSVIARDNITLDVIVPIPDVNVTALDNQTVGQSLTLQCEVTTVRGITSSVDIVWSSGGVEIERMDNVNATAVGNSSVYRGFFHIPILNTTDNNRVIECEAVVDVDPTVIGNDSIMLNVIVPIYPINITTDPVQGALVGSPQLLNCTVNTVIGVDPSIVMISWLGPGGSPITSNTRITIDQTTSGNDEYTSSLEFTYLMEDDEGSYTCNVTILATSVLDSVQLEDFIIPVPDVSVVAEDIQNQIVGQPLMLECNVTTVRGITSRVDIVWSVDGNEADRVNNSIPSLMTADSIIYSESYTIMMLSTDDEGKAYHCNVVISAIVPVMANDSVTLDVTVPPPVVNVTALNNQLVGQSLTLQCEVTAVRGITSRVDIVWSSGGTVLRRMNDVSSTMIGNSLVYTHNYTIFPLSTADEARVYQCDVEINANPPAEGNDSIALNVIVPDPSVNLSLVQPSVLGNPQAINCTVSTVSGVESTAVMISWMNSTVSIANSNRISIRETTSSGNDFTSSLQFAYLVREDEDNYTCSVAILETTVLGSIILEDFSNPNPPEVTIVPPSPIQDAIVGNRQVINCTATTPVAVDVNLLSFVWVGPGGDNITNSTRISVHPTIYMNNMYVSSLQFDYLLVSDGGNYTCIVEFFTVTAQSTVVMEEPDYAPTNVAAMALTSRSVEVTWEPPAPVSNVISYVIFYTPAATYATGGSLSVNGYNTISDVLTNLEESTLYTISVQARTNTRSSGISEETTVTTYTDVPSSPPRNVVVMPLHPGALNVSWRPPVEIDQNGPLTYVVEYTDIETNIAMNATVTSGTHIAISALDPYDDYLVRVAARTVNGTGNFSDYVMETSGHEEPSMPRSLITVAITYTTMNLSWAIPAMPNGIVVSYHLQYRRTGDANLAYNILFPIDNQTSRMVTGLSPSTEYDFRVSAVTVVGRGPYTDIITNITLGPVAVIVSSPAGTPVSGSTNTFDYPILSSVTLTCMVDPLPVITVGYRWNTAGCYNNSNYNGGNPSCFPNGRTTRVVTDEDVTAEDAGTITCTMIINDYEYTSEPFTLRISGIAATGVLINHNQIVTANQLPDYSYINVSSTTSGTSLIARCVTGLGPSGSDDNNALGGLYFDGRRIPNGVCNNSIQTSTASFVGVINLSQCGAFSTDGEGVYTCTMMNSTMMYQSTRFGIYFIGRTAPIIDQIPEIILAAINTSLTLRCTSRGSPPDTFTWMKDDSVVLSSTVIGVDHTSTSAVFNASYTIDSVTTNDSALYTCVITNPLGTNSTSIVVINAIADPVINVSGPTQPVVGSPQNIQCTVSTVSGVGASLVIISWMGPGGNSIIPNSRVSISPTDSSGNTHTSFLQFTYLTEGDEGSYTCNVTIMRTNATASESFELTNFFVPAPDVRLTATSSHTLGRYLTLLCNVEAVRGITVSSVNVVWRRNGQELTTPTGLNATSTTASQTAAMYRDSYTTTEALRINDTGTVLQCEVTINTSPQPVSTYDSITLEVIPPAIYIDTSPAGVPVSGSPNTFDYPILSDVNLMCRVEPSPQVNVGYSWNTMGCYQHINYTGNTPRCFSHDETAQIAEGSNLLAGDGGTITCTVTIYGDDYTSGPFTLRISDVVIVGTQAGHAEVVSENVRNDYSFIFADNPGGNTLIARCVTGLGPNNTEDNNALGGLYFNGIRIPNGECDASAIQPNGAPITDFVGVINLYQCGELPPAREGIYTCTMMNSAMMYQSVRLGIYIPGRTNPVINDRLSSSNVTAVVGSSPTISCTSQGSPPDTFTWRKDNDPTVLQSASITAVDHTNTSAVFHADYSIDNVTTSDSGTYTCTVTNPIGSDSAMITVVIIEPPAITIMTSGPLQGTIVGDPLIITCTAILVLNVSFVWIGPDGQTITTGANRVVIPTTTSSGNNHTSSLQFSYLMEGDEGTYTCHGTVMGVIRSNSATIGDLNVPTPIVNVTALNTQTVSQSLTLDCSVTTVRGITSRVDIVWSSGGMELERMNGVSSTEMDNSLVYTHSYTISQLSTTDEGRMIQCEVVINTSPLVRVTDSITLDVTVPNPTVTISPSTSIQGAMVGSPQVITCAVTTVSGVESSSVMIDWMAPGGSIISDDSDSRVTSSLTAISETSYTNRLQFAYLMEGDEGTYACSVRILDISVPQPVTIETLSVPAPTVALTAPNVQIVGRSLTLLCEVTTVRGITSSVDIVWSSGGMELNRTNGTTPMTTDNSLVYTDLYTIPILMTMDKGRVIQCETVINTANVPIVASDHIILDASTIGPPAYPVVTEVMPSPNSVMISWTIPIIAFDYENYSVVYSNEMGMLLGTKETMGSTDLNAINETFSVIIDGLTPFTTYSFVVRATNSNGTAATGPITFTTDEAAPVTAPSDFKVVDVMGTNITFQWDPLTTGINGIIRIYKINCTSENGNTFMANISGDAITGTISDVDAFTEYSCTIHAVTVADGPASSNVVVTTLQAPSTPPIIEMVTDINTSAVRVTWSQPAMPNGIISLYTITYSVDGDSTDVDVDYSGEQRQSYDITGLSPYQLVTVTITATNGGGISDSSDEVSGRSSESVPGVVEVIEIIEETVKWSSPLEPNGIIINYQVIYFIYQNDTGVVSELLDKNDTTYSIQSLSAGVPYEVVVVAFTSAGKGEENDHEVFFFKELAPTKPPEDVESEQLGSTSLNITWTPLTLFEAQGFPEYRVVLTPLGTISRRKRQSDPNPVHVMTTEDGFATFTGLRQDTDYSVVVGVRTGNTSEFLDGNAINVTTRVPESDEDSSSPLALIIGVSVGGGALILIILLLIICCCCMSRRSRSGSYAPSGIFKNTGFIRTSFNRASFSKKHEQALIGVDYSNEDSMDREHTTFQMVPIHTKKGKTNSTSGPIALKDFSVHVAAMHRGKNHGFEIEYESLGTSIASADIAKLPANRMKNRYANIFAYDESRVVLHKDNESESNYINASYIDGYNKPNAYIATQGPMPETLDDFWQMIWDQKCPTIVMLTKFTEGNKPKCMKYWPDNIGESITPKPSLKVTLTQQRLFADYEIRTIQVQLTSEPDSAPLELNHFFYTGWPDHGVPKYAIGVISFIKRVRQNHPKDGPPMVVHCSAGVGRTGTFIVIDVTLERIPQTHDIDIFECVQEMRGRRMSMVQTVAQYIFIHDALDEIINCGETAFNAQNIGIKMKRLSQISPETKRSGFDEQFELLQNVSRPPSPDECSVALSEQNKEKNFSSKAIPFDDSRVCLYGSTIPGSDYINASFVDGYRNRNAYIATQCPMVPTVDSFWRMLWEFKSAVVVTLCSPQHDKENFLQYWPGKDTEYETFKVALTSSGSTNGYDHYKFIMSNQQQNSLEVTMLHYTDWPAGGIAKDTNALLSLIKEVIEIQRSRSNRPVTVMCSDGCSRTGTFITICYALDRLNIEGTVDIFHAIKSARICRAGLVENVEQYKFCYEVVSEFLDAAVF